MLKVVGALCCLLVVAAVVVAFVVAGRDRRRFRRRSLRRTVQAICIKCQGRGWIQEQNRTLEFDGEAFVDEEPRTTQCTACHGTGVVLR